MKYNGIITPMLTPFNHKGEIDYSSIDTLVKYLKSIGVSGIFPSSSTGLFPFLSTNERKKMLERVLENSGSIKVFAGIGAADTDSSINLAKHARDVGANGVVLMPSYYITSSQEWIINHFEKVLKAVDIDLIIYNNPKTTGTNIELKTLEHLKSNYSQVLGIKDSSGDMRYFERLLSLKDSNFSVFQGEDDLMFISLMIGADGGVCAISNFSEDVVNLYNSYTSDDLEKTRTLQKRINGMMDILLLSNFPAMFYYAFYRKFNIKGGYRDPMVRPSKKVAEKILDFIKVV